MAIHEELQTLLRKIERAKPKVVSSDPNEGYTGETAYLERERREVQLEGERQDIKERKRYAFYFFILSCVWVLFIGALLFFEGFGVRLGFHLSDSLLLAAIGSTTANILGILYVVAHYLFRTRS
jgi:hypothetical protein